VVWLRQQKKPALYSKQANKFLDKLDADAENKVMDAIDKIPDGDISPYRSKKGYFRMRVSDYRILFTWLESEIIFVAVIENRGQAYKKGV